VSLKMRFARSGRGSPVDEVAVAEALESDHL
jgi:hypothetical protein